jgi:hypothetical protein
MDSGAAKLACNNASGVGRAGTETLKVDGNVVSTQKKHGSPGQTLYTIVNIGAAAGTPVDDKDYQIPFKFNGELDKITIKLEPLQLTLEADGAFVSPNVHPDETRLTSPDLAEKRVHKVARSSATSNTARDESQNSSILPTEETLTVASLAQLGHISGQGEFILRAANSQHRPDRVHLFGSVEQRAVSGDCRCTRPAGQIVHRHCRDRCSGEQRRGHTGHRWWSLRRLRLLPVEGQAGFYLEPHSA